VTVEVAGASDPSARLRGLPAIDRLADALGAVPHASAVAAARHAVAAARAGVLAGEQPPSFEALVEEAREVLSQRERARLRRVINATGVLIHTNLGRVPLGEQQLEAVAEIAGGYSNLEYDLDTGRRGSRYAHVRWLLGELTGAPSALVVNNNAAAVLVSLAALCAGREVIISRGELIEIGGEFRIPDVMALSGARLVEVGTTNRTSLEDYERAVGANTAAILKVHPSNYAIVGFTSSAASADLARLARGRGVLFMHDVGSGLVGALPALAGTSEPAVHVSLEQGADLVTFSGDKLMGGPQAGVIAGRSELIERIEHHPLMRAVRVDKMSLAALEATVRLYLAGRSAELPLWRMIDVTLDELEGRARFLAARLRSTGDELEADAVSSRAVTGGGSLPGAELSSWAVAVTHRQRTVDALERALRRGEPPVVARIDDDRLVMDLRTVDPSDDPALAQALIAAVG
jgi:L-seryl-tRNA(Ser) seleniumtransferase